MMRFSQRPIILSALAIALPLLASCHSPSLLTNHHSRITVFSDHELRVTNNESPNFYSIQTEGLGDLRERQLSPKRHILLQPFAGLTNLI